MIPVKIMLVGADAGLAGMVKDTSEILQWCNVVMEEESPKAAGRLLIEKYDGIVLNAEMAGIDGFELTKKIRTSSLNSSAPIVMLTDDNSVEVMRRGFNAGVTFFSIRPTNRQRVYSLFNAVRGLMVQERRRHVRLPFRTRVTCQWGSQQEKQFIAESTSIGEGGMSFQPSGGLSIGQEVSLSFEVSTLNEKNSAAVNNPRRSVFSEPTAAQNEPKLLRGVVRWERPQEGVGIEFLQMPQTYRRYIVRFISGAEDKED